MSPRFSVLIPAFNREDCLGQTIDSVLAQTFTDYELIVVNDGSTDGTQRVLDSYGSRIKALRQPQSGPEVARNHAAAQARGEYLALLDSDDLFLPCTLATYDQIIRHLKSPPLIIGAMRSFAPGEPIPSNERTDRIELLRYEDFLCKDTGVGMSSSRIVIRKSAFEQVGGLRNSTPKTFHADDYNLLLRACTASPFLLVEQPVTVAYRYHGNNSIHNTQAMLGGILALVQAEHRGEYPGGRARRFERYARIGGPAQQWIRRGFKSGQRGLAWRLLQAAWPMVIACAITKLKRQLRPPTRLVLSNLTSSNLVTTSS